MRRIFSPHCSKPIMMVPGGEKREAAVQAVKRGWLGFRTLPMALQVVTWVVISFLVVGLFSGSQEPDTEMAATRRSTTTGPLNPLVEAGTESAQVQ
ncbi:MAG TPA: hypothetical protein VGR26_02050 [Acidimicrobiales bacterium]|nr:hypothetical protein [Acidimicrobiales bacterium]